MFENMGDAGGVGRRGAKTDGTEIIAILRLNMDMARTGHPVPQLDQSSIQFRKGMQGTDDIAGESRTRLRKRSGHQGLRKM